MSRVAMVINSLQRGGAEQQFLRVARGLVRAGHEVRIYTLLPDHDFADDFAAGPLAGVPVHLLADRPGPATVIGAVRALRSWRPDVVLSFLYQATLVARLAAVVARTPVVVSSMRNERLESRLRATLYRLTARVDDATVTNSHRAAQVLEQERTVPRGALRVIPNGLDLSLFDRTGTGTGTVLDARRRAALRAELGVTDGAEVLFVGVGRHVPQKNWSLLVDAVQRYDGPPARWAVAGDGALREELQARIDAAGLTDRVTLLGLRDDVPDLLAAADALVLTSTYEGLPNVVLEAMASGRPVVATRVGGTPELVSQETGVLVDSGDAAGLADALATVAAWSPDRRARAGAAARDRAHRDFGLDAAEAAWVGLLDDLLTAAGRPRSGGPASGGPAHAVPAYGDASRPRALDQGGGVR